MWCANLNQIFRKNPTGSNYESWVLFISLKSGTDIENAIRDKHEEIDTILASQNANFSEVTTYQGKQEVYKKFKFQNGSHPLFYVFNKHPLSYNDGDRFMVIEWGKWIDIQTFKNDLMAFVNFFSDETFRKKIAEAKDVKMWKKVVTFLKDHGLEIISTGASIAAL